MYSTKKALLKTLLTANAGCGCGRPKLSDVKEPCRKPKTISIYHNPNPRSHTSSSVSAERNGGLSLEDDDLTSTTISEAETDQKLSSSCSKSITPNQYNKLVDSVPVEKDSEDPYNDFRHSMLQMIFEKEIFTENDLQELLSRFLELNSPCHHQIIIKAFSEICQQIFAKRVQSTARHNS